MNTNEPLTLVELTAFAVQRRLMVDQFPAPTAFSGGTLLVVQLVEAPRYESEGRGFDSQWIGILDRLCGLVVRVSGYRYRGLGFDSRRYQIL